jgi:hypothetical protein
MDRGWVGHPRLGAGHHGLAFGRLSREPVVMRSGAEQLPMTVLQRGHRRHERLDVDVGEARDLHEAVREHPHRQLVAVDPRDGDDRRWSRRPRAPFARSAWRPERDLAVCPPVRFLGWVGLDQNVVTSLHSGLSGEGVVA